ncbi:MAG: A/G-specific adenine glycosylase [Candidatus Promineifilaceae bacterium]|jgi:A/G-specific adenine glycosylase
MKEFPLSDALLKWWDAERSVWPWRESQDPYAVWVAEVMLQQTQLSTVLPYYLKWMDLFPDVEKLSRATEREVLKAWEGLGYYSRARNLHKAARMVVNDFEGQLPHSAQELQMLPGIGPYTAGAVASIAFSEPAAAVDGNVMRVLSRLYDMTQSIDTASVKNQFWSIARELLPVERPGDFNQALMELGQKICAPSEVLCDRCPLSDRCLAFARGTQLKRPVRKKRAAGPHHQVAAGIICRDDGRFLIAKRPNDGLLGGLWEFPGGKPEAGESLETALAREIREELAIDIDVKDRLAIVEHAYSHFRITLHAFRAYLIDGTPQDIEVADHAWVTLLDLDHYPFSGADRKIIDYLESLQTASGFTFCGGIQNQE